MSLRLKLLPILLFALAIVTAVAADSAASRSTADGLYSTDQVARGKKVYGSLCARCHGEVLGGGEDSPALVGKDFLKSWVGKSVGEMVEYTRTEMPSDGPGKVTRKQSTDLAAFMLASNDFPTGPTELAPDLEQLNQTQITPKK